MKGLLLYIVLLLPAVYSHAQPNDTFQIYFPFNKSILTKETEDHLDALIFKDTLIHGDRLIILGYADFVGGKGHNDSLSYKRAAAIRDYLLKYGFDKKDITLCVGKGKIERSNVKGRDGYAPDRKVQIVIDRTAPAPPPPPLPPKPKPTPKPAPAPPAAKAMAKVNIAAMKVNESFAIENINFEPGSPTVLPQSFDILAALKDSLDKYPTLKIRIEGHVCCIVTPNSDDIWPDGSTLSERRALTVMHYLVDHGIDKKRLTSIGLGNRNPVVPADYTEEDHIKNRRVEIRITGK